MKVIFLLMFCSLFFSLLPGQSADVSDTIPSEIISKVDTLESILLAETPRHSPGKAAMRSALVPGWGQAYNRKYWKIPIVYAGLGGLGYWIFFNSGKYRDFRSAIIIRQDDDPESVDDYVDIYSEDQLFILKDFYRRNLDVSILATTAFYLLNIIDAVVDAHLYEFDISDDLSLKIQPWSNALSQHSGFPAESFGLSLHFKLH